MSLESLLRSVKRGVGAAALSLAGLASINAVAPRSAAADELAVLSAAHAFGAQGSEWHDRQLLRNTTGDTLSGRIYLTERGSQFNPDSDPFYTYSLASHTTLEIDNIYAQLKPGVNGAGTLRLVPDNGQAAPLWRPLMYDQDANQEFGASATPFDPAADGYHGTGQTLSAILSPDGYRDNPFVQSGPDGMTGTWTYTDASGNTTILKTITLAPNTTFQYTSGVTQLIGATPAPAGQLDLTITAGEARAYLSSINNASNDSAYSELPVTATQPQITGIDWNGDGVADWVDADHNGVLDGTVAVGCSAPYPWQGKIIVSPPGQYTYFGTNMPAGMGLEQGTGKILYQPPCSTAGQTFVPDFRVNGMTTSMDATFRVTN